MITAIREVGILPGKTAAARAFAIEITAYVKDKVGMDIELVRPIGANPQRIGWCTRYKDLAAYEVAWNKLIGDQRFVDLNVKTADFFVPGSMSEAIWQST